MLPWQNNLTLTCLLLLSAAPAVAQGDLSQPFGHSSDGLGDLGNVDDASVGELNEMSIEELLNLTVVSATQTEQKLEDAPAIITVITAEDIRTWGYRSLADVLRYVVGFYVVDNHIFPDATVRGITGGLRSESSLIKVLIDSKNVAFRSTSSNWIGPELIPLTSVKRIEVMKGPASALYGADAFLGVVNIITKSGEQIEGMDIYSSGGMVGESFGGSQDMTAGARLGDVDYVISAKVHGEDRSGLPLPKTSPAPSLPSYGDTKTAATGLTQFSATSLLKLKYDVSDKIWVASSAYFSAADRGAEFADWLQFAHGLDEMGRLNENRISMGHGIADASIHVDLQEDLSLDFSGLAFFGRPTPRDRIEVGSDLFYVKREFGYRGFEAKSDLSWQIPNTLSLLFGVELIADEEQPLRVLHVAKRKTGTLEAGDTRESTSDGLRSRLLSTHGARLQAVWWPFGAEQNLSLTGGVRFDYHNIYGGQPSGRAGVVYRPIEDLHLKLLYGSAFKAPSPLLLYGSPFAPGDIVGNQNLRPQRVHTFEALVLFHASDKVTLTTGISYSLLNDKAEFQRQGAHTVARNLSQVGALSMESQLQVRLSKILLAYLDVSLQYTVRNLNESGYRSQLLDSENSPYPRMVTHSGLRISPPIPAYATINTSFISRRWSSDSNTMENGNAYWLPNAHGLDTTIGYTGLELFEGKATELQLIGQNLMYMHYRDESANPGHSGIDYPLAPRVVLLRFSQSI